MRKSIDTAFPFLAWGRHYRPEWLRFDLVAGLTLAFVALPQAIAFATIAGLPISYGIYAGIVPAIIGALYASSTHLSMGPTNTSALVIFATLAPLLAAGYHYEAVLSLALLVGILQFTLGVARMGVLVNFISNAVVVGFAAGACVLIMIKQLQHALGIHIPNTAHFYETLWNALMQMNSWNPTTIGLTLCSMALMFGVERYLPRWPSGLIALAAAGTATWALHLQDYGVATVGSIPHGFPPLSMPSLNLPLLQNLAPSAIALALLGLIESNTIAKSIALHSRQIVNSNRDFIGQGLANIAAAFTSSMPVSGSFNRSALTWRLGAKTAVASVVMGGCIAGVMNILQPFIVHLPLAAISATLFMTVPRMVNVPQIRLNLLSTRSDAVTMIVTFLATLLLKVEFAVYVGVLISMMGYLARTSRPSIRALLPLDHGGKMKFDDDDRPCPQMGVMGLAGSVFFGSAQNVRSNLDRYLTNHPDMQNLLLRMHHVEVLDASGIAALHAIHHKLRERGGHLSLAGNNRINSEVLADSGLMKDIGPEYVRRNTSKAMEALFETFSPMRCYQCPYEHFKECRALKRKGREQVREKEQPQEVPDEHKA